MKLPGAMLTAIVCCRYVELFQNMSTAIVEVQRPTGDPLAGFWGPSLLAHDLFPFPEASGTGFFVAGLAWGVRKGFLEVRPPAEDIQCSSGVFLLFLAAVNACYDLLPHWNMPCPQNRAPVPC